MDTPIAPERKSAVMAVERSVPLARPACLVAVPSLGVGPRYPIDFQLLTSVAQGRAK